MHDFFLIAISVFVSMLVTLVIVGCLKVDLVKYIESVETTFRDTWDMILKVASKK